MQRRRYNAFQSDVLRGTMAFSGPTRGPGARTGTGLGAADALLGLPISGQIRYLNGTRGFRRTELGFYLQDVYKATQKLTVTLGLRYENFIGWPWTEVADRMYQFVPEKQDVVRVGTGGIPAAACGPTITISRPASVSPTDCSRRPSSASAYGMYYSAPQWDITRNLAANPPEFVVSSFANDQFDTVNARTLQQGFSRPALGSVQGTLRAIDIDARTPYTQQWNAAVQQELPSSLSLTVAYVEQKEPSCRDTQIPTSRYLAQAHWRHVARSRDSTQSRPFRTGSIRFTMAFRSLPNAAFRTDSRSSLPIPIARH